MSGLPGINGQDGEDGVTGVDGCNGTDGAEGEKGDAGPIGPTVSNFNSLRCDLEQHFKIQFFGLSLLLYIDSRQENRGEIISK